MNRVEKERADEKQSQKIFEQLQAHEATRAEMDNKYLELDDACIELAKQLSAEVFAGSPRAGHTNCSLGLLRRERDNVRTGWASVRELLIHKLEAMNLPEIRAFHELQLFRARNLLGRRMTEFEAGMGSSDFDRRQVRVRHNFAAIAEAQKDLFDTLKRVRAMNMRPLAEVRAAIAAAEEDVAERQFAFETIECTESQFRRLQQAEAAFEQPLQDRLVIRRVYQN